MADEFHLQRDRVSKPRQVFETSDRTRQKVLFAGLDCLPGQLDLFHTDGELPSRSNDGEETETQTRQDD